MIRTVIIAITMLGLALQASAVFAAQGQVLQVVDGDTFMMEVAGIRGPETIEVHLRCADAPIASAPFGKESKTYLESLLGESETIHYKVQAYCGSETCVEVLAYIPDPLNPKPPYINTRMISAGMARNDTCRGVFQQAEEQAKSSQKGIWSTTKKIVFAEVEKKVASEPQAETKKTITIAPQAAPAKIEVNRADRTVTLKSRAMSLSKAVAAIDTVSTIPVSLYMIEDQLIALSLDKISWYRALQHIVEVSNLKQVNMNGKIDLYDQLFYYKYISPHLKLADNDGVFMNLGGGSKMEPAVDDGVTRYVFVNDFENSAEAARQGNESQHGFVQVHNEPGQLPVSDHGVFEISDEKKAPAEAEVALPPLKPYSGREVFAEQVQPEVAAEAPLPVAIVEPPAVETPAVETPAVETPVKQTTIASAPRKVAAVTPTVPPAPAETPPEQIEAQKPEPAQTTRDEKAETVAADQSTDSGPVLNIEVDLTQAIILVIVIIVVVLGSIFLSRSAASRAAKAERGVDSTALGQRPVSAADVQAPLVDEAYEKEIFAGLDHEDSDEETGKAVDELFQETKEASTTAYPAADEEDAAELPVDEVAPAEPAVDDVATAEPAVDDVAPAEPAVDDVEAAEPAVDAVATAELPVDDVATAEPAVDDVEAAEPQTDEVETPEPPADEAPAKPVKKKIKALGDEGNYAVTLDDYERLMNPPKREPRKDCLFEVTCELDGQTTTGIGLDISSGGMFVDSKESYAVGKVLALTFTLDAADQEPLRCRCAVTWVNERPEPIKPNYPNGYGICFLDMDDSTRKALDAYLESNAAEGIEGALVDS